MSPEKYLEIERNAECRSEYLNGEMFAIAGASWRHTRIVTNATGQLWAAIWHWELCTGT